MPTHSISKNINTCTLCAQQFAETTTRHRPRPVTWFQPSASILIAGQAPGQRVHDSGKPFTDPSGDRLRDWLGLTDAEFYNKDRIAIVPMAFCFPGYDAKGSDLPPPKICAQTWHPRVLTELTNIKLTILVGAYAQKYHLGLGHRKSVTDTVADWKSYAPGCFPLPHPSWRNTGWIRKNPWFEIELIPVLRRTVRSLIDDTT
ncbi:MAG: uracil-DNA glycosylase family protein [Pseudoruegeria sp.]